MTSPLHSADSHNLCSFSRAHQFTYLATIHACRRDFIQSNSATSCESRRDVSPRRSVCLDPCLDSTLFRTLLTFSVSDLYTLSAVCSLLRSELYCSSWLLYDFQFIRLTFGLGTQCLLYTLLPPGKRIVIGAHCCTTGSLINLSELRFCV